MLPQCWIGAPNLSHGCDPCVCGTRSLDYPHVVPWLRSCSVLDRSRAVAPAAALRFLLAVLERARRAFSRYLVTIDRPDGPDAQPHAIIHCQAKSLSQPVGSQTGTEWTGWISRIVLLLRVSSKGRAVQCTTRFLTTRIRQLREVVGEDLKVVLASVVVWQQLAAVSVLEKLAQLFQSEARHRRPTAPRPGHRELPLARLATNRALTASFVSGVPPEDRSVRHDRIEAASYVAEECASVIQGAVQGVAAGCLSFLPGDGHVSAVARACPYWSGSSAFLAFRHLDFPNDLDRGTKRGFVGIGLER